MRSEHRYWPSSSSVATTSAGRAVDEARGGEHVEHMLAFGLAQRPGGRWTGLLVPGSGLVTTVEGGP